MFESTRHFIQSRRDKKWWGTYSRWQESSSNGEGQVDIPYTYVDGFFSGNSRNRISSGPLRLMEAYVEGHVLSQVRRGQQSVIGDFGAGMRGSVSVLANRLGRLPGAHFYATQYEQNYPHVLIGEASRRLAIVGDTKKYDWMWRNAPRGADYHLLQSLKPLLSPEVLTEIDRASEVVNDVGGVDDVFMQDWGRSRPRFTFLHEHAGGIAAVPAQFRGSTMRRLWEAMEPGGILVTAAKIDEDQYEGFEPMRLPIDLETRCGYAGYRKIG